MTEILPSQRLLLPNLLERVRLLQLLRVLPELLERLLHLAALGVLVLEVLEQAAEEGGALVAGVEPDPGEAKVLRGEPGECRRRRVRRVRQGPPGRPGGGEPGRQGGGGRLRAQGKAVHGERDGGGRVWKRKTHFKILLRVLLNNAKGLTTSV